jgi:LDH2 family malate/lactate/ureidoglycolate dehydrogenase
VRLSDDVGVSAVTISSCNHVGRLGEYVATIANAGKVGLALCNSGPAVAPYGGVGRVMGTNPLAWAAPRDGGNLVLDFATSNVAEGKLKIALAEGTSVPPGNIIDKEGQLSIDPRDFYAGGALLPFGGHKGSGLSVMIEITAGLLSRMRTSCDPQYGGGNGTLLLAVDISAFVPLSVYYEEVEIFCQLFKHAARSGAGTAAEVLLPGEFERRTLVERRRDGVYVQDAIRRDITALADSLGVDLGRFALR